MIIKTLLFFQIFFKTQIVLLDNHDFKRFPILAQIELIGENAEIKTNWTNSGQFFVRLPEGRYFAKVNYKNWSGLKYSTVVEIKRNKITYITIPKR